MTSYELSNTDRKYFGLSPVKRAWVRKSLGDNIVVYFEKSKIVKILNYSWGYVEYDTDIETTNREILLPKTPKGKKHKLSASRILRIKGAGIQFSGSFQGGNITVYDNRRNIFFIRSYLEEGQISTFTDIKAWVEKFKTESPPNYFAWLTQQVNSKRLKAKAKQGDIIAFPVGRFEYGFARILLASYLSEQLVNGELFRLNLFGKPLLILPYSFVSDTLDIDFDALIKFPPLKPIQINDSDVFYGQFPIVGFREVKKTELPKVELFEVSKYLTIPHSKTDLLKRLNKW